MPCKCGESIDLSPIPNAADFKILWDPNIESIVEKLVVLHRDAKSDEEFETGAMRLINPLTAPNPHILECSACGRIGVVRHPSDSTVAIWYAQDVDSSEHSRKSLQSLFQPT
jgi:hypothetical protein